MTNGPPCAACGWTLRWIPESNVWGCDRCRQMFPVGSMPQQPQQQAQPPQQYYQQQPQQAYQQPSPYAPGAVPQQPYQPQPAGVPPMQQQPQPPKKGGGKGLWIVLGLLVVGGGVTAAVLLLKGGGGVSGGMSSKESLVDAIVAGFNDGDGGKVYDLMLPESERDKYVDCSDDPDMQKEQKEAKDKAPEERAKAIKKLAKDKTDGLAIDEIAIDGAEHGVSIKKGDKVGSKCVSKVDVTVTELLVKVHDAKQKKQILKLSVANVDGHWFLEDRPRLKDAGGDCRSVVTHAMGVSSAFYASLHVDMGKVTDNIVAHCTDDKWSAETLSCLTAANVNTAVQACMQKTLDKGQQKGLTTAIEEGVASSTPPPTPPPPTPPDTAGSDTAGSDTTGGTVATGTGGLPPACAEYKAMIDKVANCPKMPAQSRDAMKQAYGQLEQAFSTMKNAPASSMKMMDDACKQGADALKQALGMLGC